MAGDGALGPASTVAIVGGSLTGLRATETLRAEGFTGRVVLIGEENHYPYDRPPLSKQVLAGTWPPERALLADRHRFDEMGVELHLGRRAIALDAEARRLTLEDGATVEADVIVVATGAHPRELAGPGGHPAVTVLRTIDQSNALREKVASVGEGCRVVVVGAGFIGSEIASTCLGLGCRVTVVEPLSTPLMGALGEQIGGACARLHRENGGTLLTGVGVAGVSDGPAGAAIVELADGSTLEADVVVVGIGVIPTTAWLEGSGLEVDNGVVCDAALFAAPGVVAAGDIARWSWRHDGQEELVRIEHWQVAAEAGVAAARSALAGQADAQAFTPIPYFWSDQFGLRIQVIGRPHPDDEVVVVDGSLDEKFVALYGRGGRLSAALGLSRPRQLMAFRPLLEAGSSFDDALAHAKTLA